MDEETQLVESHFKVGDKVKCIHSGKEGVVTKVDPSEKGKYYTVKRDDGEVMQYAPDDLEALKEEFELDEAGYKIPKNYAQMIAKQKRNKPNLGQSKLSSAEYQKAKTLKGFNKDDWKWNGDLYIKVVESVKEDVDLDEAAKMSAKSQEWYDKGYAMGKNPSTYKNPPFGIGGAAMDAFRKGRKAGEAAVKKEEVELDEAGYKVPKNYASMMAKKRRKAGTSEFGTHPDKKKEAKKEEIELDEMHDRYIRSHGKKASGRGGWMFTTKRMGDVDYKNDKEFYQHPGQETLSKAAVAAKKALGTKNVYVMESAEKIDELDSKTYSSYADKATADQIKRMQKKKQTDKDKQTMRRRSLGIATAQGKQYGDKRSISQRIRGESVDLEEGRNECLKALEGLVKKGGIDKADFQKAHDLYKSAKYTELRKHIYSADTDVSEAIADVINRHDSRTFNSMYPRAKSGDYLRKIIMDHK